MRLDSKDGIVCDLCSAAYRMDFTYYSFDFRKVTIHGGHKPSLAQTFRLPITASFDVCTQCFDQVKDKVVEVYSRAVMINDVCQVKSKAAKKSGEARNRGVVCELSGESIAGAHYYCNVLKIDVRMSGQPNVCVKCQRQTHHDDKPCEECGGLDFIRPADSTVDDRHVEFNVGEQAYLGMVAKSESVRNSQSWSTKS